MTSSVERRGRGGEDGWLLARVVAFGALIACGVAAYHYMPHIWIPPVMRTATESQLTDVERMLCAFVDRAGPSDPIATNPAFTPCHPARRTAPWTSPN